MSKLYYIITLNEVQVDDKGNFIKEYEKNLPHAKEIAQFLCDSWNSMDWSKIFEGNLSIPVKDSRMHSVRISPNGSARVKITTTFVEGIRLTEKRRNEFWEEMDAQMIDGWGECVFGAGNTMKFADGTYAYTE